MKHFVSMKHLTAGELLQLVQLATDIQAQGYLDTGSSCLQPIFSSSRAHGRR